MRASMRRYCGCLAAWLLCIAASAADALTSAEYANYLAELKAFERQQPKPIHKTVRYADGAKGQQLKGLLDPARTKAMAEYITAPANTAVDPFELLSALEPIIGRYDEAFEKFPRRYEAEKLDILELFVHMALQISAVSEPRRCDDISGKNGLDGFNFGLTASMLLGMVESELRYKGFSPSGAKRVQSLLDRFDSRVKPKPCPSQTIKATPQSPMP